MSIKAALTDLAKRSSLLRTVMRETRFILGRLSYFPLRLTHSTDRKLIMFESYGGRSYACSPRAIYECMLRDPRFERCRFVWAFEHPEQKLLPDDTASGGRTEKVKSGSRKYYQICSKAGIIVINSSFPERISLRSDQILVETWHGTPLKRLGYDIETEGGGDALNGKKDNCRRYDINSKRFSMLLSPSPFCSKMLISAFGLDRRGRAGIVRETGYPRNDYLYNYTGNDASEIKRKLGIPEDKRLLLYAPTYRDNCHRSGVGYTFDCPVDFAALRSSLGEQWAVLFRAHYFVANSFDFSAHEGFVYDVSGVDDINELYVISDVLVTDYSSVFFDFANLMRPMLFYMYDLEQYAGEIRGFYFDYRSVPGPIVETQEQLTEELMRLNEYEQRFGERYARFHELINPLDDGHAAERAIDEMLAICKSKQYHDKEK